MPVPHIATLRIRGWNRVAKTERDAVNFCAEHKIRIVADTHTAYGSLIYFQGHVFITLNPFLTPGMKPWVLWHEIAHYILHYPETSNFSRSMRCKNDQEANMVASVALPHTHLLRLRYNQLRLCLLLSLSFSFPPLTYVRENSSVCEKKYPQKVDLPFRGGKLVP